MAKIGFIGCGNMAQPIIRNTAEKNVFDKNDIRVYDINRDKLLEFCQKTGVYPARSAQEIAGTCGTVVFCTKPQTFPTLLPPLGDILKKKNPLIISIAAGKTTDSIAALLGYDARIARIFPNLNAEVGEAVSAYTGNKFATDEDVALTGEICRSFGKAKELDESMFSVFGVLGGCAPAYVFMFVSALSKAAQVNGMDKKTADEVAAQAVTGSAKLLRDLGGDADEWVRKVCSPGGTTIEGVNSLKADGFDAIVKKAFDSSYNRDLALANEK